MIVYPTGAAAETVIDRGEADTRFSLDKREMARAIEQVGAMGAIDSARCRVSVA